MKVLRVFLIVFLHIFTIQLIAQTPGVKDVAALAKVEAAISAMGGDAAFLQIKDSVITGTIAPPRNRWVLLRPALLRAEASARHAPNS